MMNITFESRIKEVTTKIEEMKAIAPAAVEALNEALSALEAAAAIEAAAAEPVDFYDSFPDKIQTVNNRTFNRLEVFDLIAEATGFEVVKKRLYGSTVTLLMSKDGRFEIVPDTTKVKQVGGLLVKSFRVYDHKCSNHTCISFNYKKGEYVRAV